MKMVQKMIEMQKALKENKKNVSKLLYYSCDLYGMDSPLEIALNEYKHKQERTFDNSAKVIDVSEKLLKYKITEE